MNIFQSARISILINGSPKGYFGCSRGVRHGDPLSPLLFFLAEDFLNRWLVNAFRDNFLVLMHVPGNTHCPSHLLYADDVLIFCKASKVNLQRLVNIFHEYGSISGQDVNWNKSEIFFGNSISFARMNSLCSIAGFWRGSLPFTYLGVPLFIGAPKKKWLQAIANRILSNFDKWKGTTLSMAGRLALINSVIYSSFLHSFMVYRWPSQLLKHMEKCIRNFLWTGDIKSKKCVTVK